MKSLGTLILSFGVFLLYSSVALCHELPASVEGETWGQKLAAQGVDTSSVEQLRGILRLPNDSPNYEVLMHLIEQPKTQLVEDIVPYLQNSISQLRLAAAGALLQLGDPRGITALDSVIQSTMRSNPGGRTTESLRQIQIDEKVRAIALFAKTGTYGYSDSLMAALIWCARYGYLGEELLTSVRDYGAEPTYEDTVVSDVKGAYLYASSRNRGRILKLIYDLASPVSMEFLLNVLKSDTSFQSRSAALMYLARRPSVSFESYVFSEARNEPNPILRKQLYNYIRDLGTPSAIWTLNQLFNSESSEDIRWSLGFWLSRFKVKPSILLVQVSAMLDSLRSFQHQCSVFDWLSDGSFNSDLDGDLERARQALISGDSTVCARAVRTFQNMVDLVYKDSLNPDPRKVSIEGWKFLYHNAQYILDRLPQIPPSPELASLTPLSAIAGSSGFTLNLKGKSFVSSSMVIWNGSSRSTSFVADSLLQATIPASDLATTRTVSVAVVNPGNDTSNVLPFAITQPPTGLNVKLINSTGSKLTGGSLQYYDGTWKDATNNNDGTFGITTSLKTLSLRMTYEFATQTKSNVTVGFDTVAFQTVNASVQLKNSQGALMDQGTVQYYFSSWKSFGVTTSGVVTRELLPGNYTFRMAYAAATNDKQQNISTNATVVFQTVNAAIQLKNSQGSFIDQGTVQYYFSSWNNFGATTDGVATKELLPGNYTFRMTYEFATNDRLQNIGTNAVVVFQTVNAMVQLRNSQGAPIDTGRAQYYFSSWKELGLTSGGVATKELLPASYTFRMTHESVSNDKVQNISTNSTVSFSTVLCTVSVKNAQSQPVNNAMISYYSTAWKQIALTLNGQVSKELLPANLTFRMTLGAVSQDKAQNIGTSSLVEFVTQ